MALPEIKDIENWVQLKKTSALYKARPDNSIANQMLKRDKTNAYHSSIQAQRHICLSLCDELCPDLQLNKIVELCSDFTLTVTGYGRLQAIEVEKNKAVADNHSKKSGLLGVLGIGDKDS